MAGTKLSDVIVPELFNPYVVKTTLEKSALVKCGIIENNSEFDTLASANTPFITMPFFQDLSGESETIVEDEPLTADGIKSSADIAVIRRTAKMWSATDLSAALAGKDPMEAIGSLVAGFWVRDMQKELISILKGIFGKITGSPETEWREDTTYMKDHILDISGQSSAAAKITSASFIDATQLLGDNKDILSGIAMHSAVEAALEKQDMIDIIRPSDGGAPIKTYMGKEVIVDDGLPHSGNGANMIFSTYLFGNGAFAFGNGSPVGFTATEVDRDKKMGSGVDYLINRRTSILHPRGIAWQNKVCKNVKSGPTRVEMADPKNWKPVYDMKDIRIVELRHKI